MSAQWRCIDRDSGSEIAAQLEICATFLTRLRGLQFRREFPSGQAMLLSPCNAVHTMFLRFAIDVAFLDCKGTVTAVRRSIQPWRITTPQRDAVAVLEMPAGTMPLEPGRRICLSPDSSNPRPLAKPLNCWQCAHD